MRRKLSRREMLKRAAAAGAATAVPAQVLGQAQSEPYTNLTASESRALEAIVARLIPSDTNGPGALEAGAARYIDRALGDALAGARDAYRAGLAAVDSYARRTAGKPFADLDADAQDAVLRAIEQDAAAGFTGSSTFFNLVLGHTLEGTFGDPYYGGNRDFVGWELLGYPGIRLAVTAEEQRMASEPRMARLGAYDFPAFEDDAHGGEHDR